MFDTWCLCEYKKDLLFADTEDAMRDLVLNFGSSETLDELVEMAVVIVDDAAAVASPEDLSVLADTLDHLREAARTRQHAVEHRLAGRIREALEAEADSETHFHLARENTR